MRLLFDKFDTDGDKCLSEKDFKVMKFLNLDKLWKLLSDHFDFDGDGTISEVDYNLIVSSVYP